MGTHIPWNFWAHPFPTGEVSLGVHVKREWKWYTVFGVAWRVGVGRRHLTLAQEGPPNAGAEWIFTLGIIDCLWISQNASGPKEKSILFFVCF